ncbi:peptidoglycan-binding domain-containing protein [Streptomyces longwoodensis]|uniref:peptidoglycan-binding domain-containing protein n=1 Tax=Streptomyces longwoodensis TaxID=68231 RepID=UPI0022584A72|nr:peptidoglycan-binding domain-containing protein [Streptomyces longwoodensis]MCX4997510.1 peptidoglycan-binding protein [Streptomyces longwoodensis]
MPTPPEPGESPERPVLEPIRVLRPRRTDALAELFRELTEDRPPTGYEPVALGAGRPGGGADTEADTRELPPVPGGPAPGASRPARPGPRRAAVAGGVAAAALAGFACALLLPGTDGGAAARTPPTATAAAPAALAPADPDGPGTLREGDNGPEVTDLQERLRRVPDVYDDGPTDGRYGTVLAEAVARFQLWYGVRGDESGVYGDDTRRDLESRT